MVFSVGISGTAIALPRNMNQGHRPPAPLGDPWFKAESVFAAAHEEQTQCLDLLDLLPADAREAIAGVTYQRDGGAVSLRGASLVFDQTGDFLTELGSPALFQRPSFRRLGELVWELDAGLRRLVAVSRQTVHGLARRARDRQLPLGFLAGAFGAGIGVTALLGWLF